MKRKFALLFGVATLALSGCGGGGGSSSAPIAGGGSAMTFGEFETRAVTAGPLQAITATSGGPVFTGIAGGAFSSIVLNPTPDLASTRILFGRAGQVYSIKPDGTGLKQISATFSSNNVIPHPTWSPDGRQIAYVATKGGVAQLMVSDAEGGNAVDISPSSVAEFSPSWCPVNNQIAYSRYDSTVSAYQVYRRNSDGSGIAHLSDKTAWDMNPCWSPDGSKIAFARYDTALSHYQIYIMSSNGGSVHPLSGGFTSYDCQYPSWSPDGSQICFALDYGANHYLYSVRPDGSDGKQILYSTSDNFSEPSFSPDNRSIVFKRSGSGVNGLWIVANNGEGARQITNPTGSTDWSPSWSAFPAKRTLVGSGGAFGSSAAGFLYSQSHEGVQSVLVFGSASPLGTAVSTADNVPGADQVVYQIDGSLNSIKFYNGLGSNKTILPSGSVTSATGALVSFDTVTGYVSSVVPFTASRGTTVTKSGSGGTRSYTGDFLGVYDAAGKNLAPGGAHEISVEAQTGKVTVRR